MQQCYGAPFVSKLCTFLMYKKSIRYLATRAVKHIDSILRAKYPLDFLRAKYPLDFLRTKYRLDFLRTKYRLDF